ncbi:MAG TPA: ABC transporter permease [Tissierellia bacterium]|jgi:peptide/nickel transport system permease protein|nr:ABC transporter permease [Tissierellia bacterium]
MKKDRGQFREIWRRLRKNRAAMIGLSIIIVVVLLAVFADVIGDYHEVALKVNTSNKLQPPSLSHPFGTDIFGRDVLARIAHGARLSLSIALITTLASFTIACFFGAAVAYWGGWFDIIVMRICDLFMCIPGILLALAIIAALGTSKVNLIIALIIASLPGNIRFIRSLNLTIIEQDYIEAAKAYGASDFRVIVRHILLNALGPIIVQATMNIASIIISTASLSFLGMGVKASEPEWGSMLAESAEFLRTKPFLTLIPGAAIVFSALAMNLLGDGLRDALDPRLRT